MKCGPIEKFQITATLLKKREREIKVIKAGRKTTKKCFKGYIDRFKSPGIF